MLEAPSIISLPRIREGNLWYLSAEDQAGDVVLNAFDRLHYL
jgi:hypothetical protein